MWAGATKFEQRRADCSGQWAVNRQRCNSQRVERCAPGVVARTVGQCCALRFGNQRRVGHPLNKFDEIINYNNYYEFSTNKEAVADLAKDFSPYPWQVEVTGLVKKPTVFSLEDIYKQFTQEERIYRLRCVEGWSMVIPWVGFPIGELLKAVEPTAAAKFVKFTSVMRPEEMPGQGSAWLEWPYVEGLRLDEAMNPLAIFATGMYGKPLTNQQGAPVRMVVPWKYGFKSIKGDRQGGIGRHDAGYHLGDGGAQRIWVLRQREPDGGSSPLVPSQRAAHRRLWPATRP